MRLRAAFQSIAGLGRGFAADPVGQLIAVQTALLLIGVYHIGFSISTWDITAALVTSVVAELLFANIPFFLRRTEKPVLFFPKSALAAGLGITLFFRAISPWYFVLATALAIGSKYVLKLDGKHIFNPSNFGIVTVAFLFSYATTIEFTQWGNEYVLYAAMCAVIFFVAYRAGVIATTISFYVSYTLLLLFFVATDMRYSVHHYGLLSPSLALFASFMITDPRTSPRTFGGRILHGVAVAAGYFVLECIGLRYALFAASFLVTILNQISSRLVAVKRLRIAKAPANAITAAVCVVACAVAFISVLRSSTVVLPPKIQTISPLFIAWGIESSSVRRCNDNPTFKPSRSTFSAATQTYGAAWGDYDGDDYDDLLLSNMGGTSYLYHNDRGQGFTDVTSAAGLPAVESSSAAFVDYDNNGSLDLVMIEKRTIERDGESAVYVAPRVFKNTAGKYSETTRAVGLADVLLPQGAGLLTFGDYDNNGTLDMVIATVGTALRYDEPSYRAMEKSYQDPFFFGKQVYLTCGIDNIRSVLDENRGEIPASFDRMLRQHLELPIPDPPCVRMTDNMLLFAYASSSVDAKPSHVSTLWYVESGAAFLFENRSGRFVAHPEFTEYVRSLRASMTQYVNELSKLETTDETLSGRFFQPTSFDYDNDGRQDILFMVDAGHNLLLRNTGHFTFEDTTLPSGMNRQGSGMGVDVSDWNGDGKLDVALTNILSIYLYEGAGTGTFKIRRDLPLFTYHVGWGISFLDYNLDGHDDVFASNGISESMNGPAVEQPLIRPLFSTALLYRNVNGERLRNTTAVDLCPDSSLGLAVAVSDYDNDGDPDVFNSALESKNILYENTLDHNGLHYLKVKLQGRVSNRMGAGAVVRVTSDSAIQTKVLLVGNSYRSENSQTLLFGLATSSAPVTVRVEWPSGLVTQKQGVTVDQTIKVFE